MAVTYEELIKIQKDSQASAKASAVQAATGNKPSASAVSKPYASNLISSTINKAATESFKPSVSTTVKTTGSSSKNYFSDGYQFGDFTKTVVSSFNKNVSQNFSNGYDFGDISKTILGTGKTTVSSINSGLNTYSSSKNSSSSYTSAFDTSMHNKYSSMSLSQIENEYLRVQKEIKLLTGGSGGKLYNYLARAGAAISGGLTDPSSDASSVYKQASANIDKINDLVREEEIINVYRKQRATEEYLGSLTKEQIQMLDNIADAEASEDIAPLYINSSGIDASTYYEITKVEREASKQARAKLQEQLKAKNPGKTDEELDEIIDDMVELRKNQRNAEETASMEESMSEFATEHPVASFLLSRGASVLGGGTGLYELYAQRGNEYGIDTNAPGFTFTNASAKIDEQVQLDHDWKVGGVDAFDLFYEAGTGIVDNVARLAVSGGNTAVAGAMMFPQITTQSIIEGKKKGYSDSKALALGLLDGTFEAVSEKLSLDAILGSKGGALKTLAKSFAAEGSEEVTSSWLNRIADEVANGNHSELSKKYEELLSKGYSESKALAETILSAVGEDTKAFVMGGIAGTVLGGGNIAVNAVSNVAQKNAPVELDEKSQKVVDKVVEIRVEQEKQKGNKVTKSTKNKIRNEVIRDLDKGYLDKDSIYSEFGGEDYESYKKAKDLSDDSIAKGNQVIKNLQKERNRLQKEYDVLYKMKNGEKSDEQIDRQNTLKERIAEIDGRIEQTESIIENLGKDERLTELKDKLDANVSEVVKDSKLAETFLESDRGKQAFSADTKQYKNEFAKKTVQNAIDYGVNTEYGFNNTNAAHDFVDFAAKIASDKKVEVVFTNTEGLAKLKEGKNEYNIKADPNKINAFISEEHNKMFINMDTNKSLQSLVGHEITHTTEKAKSYNNVAEFVKSVLGEEEFSKLVEKKTETYKNLNLSKENIEKEVVADFIGDKLFTDYDFIKRLSVENRNIFQQIWDEIKYLCNVATAGSKELRELEKLKHQFEKAYKESSKSDAKVEGTKNSLSDSNITETDNKYLSAVESGDTETAQKMVDEAAKNAGYTIKGFHATNEDFNVFDVGKTNAYNYHGKGIYFTNSTRDLENNYENYEGPDPWQKIEERAYELADEMYDISYNDTLTADSDVIGKLNECYDKAIDEFKSTIHRVNAYIKFDNPIVLKKGEATNTSKYDFSKHDGIIDEQVHENIGHSGMDENTVHYVVWNPRNIKSADTVTYDDNGNVIPLSERFKAENNDIRYSLNEDVDNVEKILYDKNNSLSIVNRAKTYNNSSLKWVYDSEIFSVEESILFHEKISGINQGSEAFGKNSAGEYMIPIENKIVFTDGNYDSPYVREIVEVLTEHQTRFDDIRECIYSVEKGRSDRYATAQILAKTYPNEPIVSYRDGIGGVYGWEDGKRKGKSRSSVIRNYLNKQLRRRNDSKSQETPISEIAPINEASSTDGVFFDAEKTKFSLSEDSNGRKLTKEQQDFFKRVSPLLKDENGNIKRYYHGTARGDRVGTLFDPKRATSGPMAFFTDNPEIAEGYSKSKADTSMAYDSDYDSYETQFRAKINGVDMSLIDAWRYLPMSARARIKDRAEHTHYDWDDYETLIYDEETTEAGGGFSWQLREARGNVLRALNEQWLNSGNLFNEEGKYIDVLKFIGVHDEFKKLGYGEPYYKDPYYRDEKVFEVYLNVTNPFHTADVDEEFLADAKDWIDNTNLSIYESETADSDLWDKRSLDPYEWLERLESDIENGTTHAWTSIPDVITDFLKEYGGYDGIVDAGGKHTGYGHQVVIPFYSEQIKNIDNETPTTDAHIDLSLSDEGETFEEYGNFNTYAKDITLQSDIAPTAEAQPVAETAATEQTAPIQENVAPMADDNIAPVQQTTPETEQVEPMSETEKLRLTLAASPRFTKYAEKAYDSLATKKSELSEEYEVNKAEFEYNKERVKDKNEFFKTEALGLYVELKNLKKGVKASDDLGYLLDYGYDWAELKSTLLKVSRNPDKVLNPDSSIENVVRDHLNQRFETLSAYSVEKLEADYNRQVEEAEAYTKSKIDGFLDTLVRESQERRAGEKILGDSQIGTKTPVKDDYSIKSDIARNLISKDSVFETLALKKKNRALEDKLKLWRSRSGAMSEYFMKNGKGDVPSLKSIVDKVNKAGLSDEFDLYLKHRHNTSRAYFDKPIFGYDVTGEMSLQTAAELQKQHPEFKEWAKDVYKYNDYLLQKTVEGGLISAEFANELSKKYPNYVPIERILDGSIKESSDGISVGNPIKTATGGESATENVLKAMAHRTRQVFNAVNKNVFGVELMNTLVGDVESASANTFDVLNGLAEMDDALLQPGKGGNKPTFTVFEYGKAKTFEITNDMYKSLQPTSKAMSREIKALSVASNLHKKLITEYNLAFTMRNASKDAQEVFFNSHHAAKTYANMPVAFGELLKGKGKYVDEYWENGGKSITYFEGRENDFVKDKNAVRKVLGYPLEAVSKVNEFVESVPRLAEYIASRKSGATIEASMLDAARVTTDFSDGGDITKFFNRNGATFLNASVQGASQHIRNFRQAKAEGATAVMKVVGKYALSGLPVLLFNSFLWDDDEDYEDLSDYVKDNYYVVAKYGDRQFVRIPKGRTAAVIQEATEQVADLIANDDTDWDDIKTSFEAVKESFFTNIAPNNPFTDNVIAPLKQAYDDKAWYGEAIVPSSLKDVEAREQFDESTDSISKWLGEKTGISPYKINYVLNQYSGFVGDIFLPMLTPEAERGDSSLMGNLLAPLKDQFVVDGVIKNRNPSEFYILKDELNGKAISKNATAEDKFKYEYIKSIGYELGELYNERREIHNSNLPDDVKFKQVREVQDKINQMAKDALETYENVEVDGNFATANGIPYKYVAEYDKWYTLKDYEIDDMNASTEILGITPGEYWSDKDYYNMAALNPEKLAILEENGISTKEYFDEFADLRYYYDDDYAWAASYPDRYVASKFVSSMSTSDFRNMLSELWSIEADPDGKGGTVYGTQKTNREAYIASLDIPEVEKFVLHKWQYPYEDDYNDIVLDYINSRSDIPWEQKKLLLEEMEFMVSDDGYVSW